MDRLTQVELATMRAEHVDDGRGYCAAELSRYYVVRFPCSTARLIHDFAPGPVPHLAGIDDDHCHCGAAGIEMSHPRHAPTPEQQAAIGVGLLGPSLESELPR